MTGLADSPAAPRPDGRARAAAPAADAEWLLADGAGGYACGTVADLPARRYHGLWIARAGGAALRSMVVAGVDERLGAPPDAVSLLHAHWRGQPAALAPAADVAFAPRPFPAWTFRPHRARAVACERAVLLQRAAAGRAPALLLRWRNLGAQPLRLAVRPLLGWCDADRLPAARGDFDGTVAARGASWGFRPDPALPALWLSVDGVAAFTPGAEWYRGFWYAIDRERGYDHVGDRWSPGTLELELGPGRSAWAAFALAEPEAEPAAAWAAAAAAAVARDEAAAAQRDPLRGALARGADDFLYRDPQGRPGVLAGFPWFGEWGRDAFVALPGLTLARGDHDGCAAVLAGALPFLRGGLLPNVYGGTSDDSHYDSCDAALWWTLAVQRFADAGGDDRRVRDEFVPAMAAIADACLAGTGLGVRADERGALLAGGPTLNATWMDARTAHGPVTPRDGCAVELQALWYALLDFLVAHGERRFAAPREQAGVVLARDFWLADGRYLADRLHGGGADRSVRPNMVIAAALGRSPLSVAQRRGVVARADAELVTPRGLRTLSPRDPAYRGRYQGGPEERDTAYHQGTAWPWLGGFWIEATLRAAAKKDRPAVRAALRGWLAGFLPELGRAGLDHLSEVFDGDEPQRPAGTFAQAWNTGELLRAAALLDGEDAP